MLLRWLGHDRFDDFDLLLHVHSVQCENRKEKLKSYVKVTAGVQTVKTEAKSKGYFEQPLHLSIEQGTEKVVIELIEEGSKVLLAKKDLAIERDILLAKPLDKAVLPMTVKAKGLTNVRIQVSTSVTRDSDLEKGLLRTTWMGVGNVDTKFLLEQQIRKAGEKHATFASVGGSGDTSDREDPILDKAQKLKLACAGPLGYFEALGIVKKYYCGVRGPPDSRDWILGLYETQEDFERRRQAVKEIDLRRIASIGGDPGRNDVFVITFFDKNRDKQRVTFRTIDINREVWLEMLRELLKIAQQEKQQKQKQPKSRTVRF